MDFTEITKIRQALHRIPETAHQEFKTARYIKEYFESLKPDSILELDSTGMAFIFGGKSPGKTVVFRAELDALAIEEHSEKPYRSTHEGRGHLCGHDGHMAILCALGELISRKRPESGRAALLFQPAEETMTGARDIAANPDYRNLNPDFVFALHNLPGTPLNQVVVKEGIMTAASCGMELILKGKTGHAAEPELGNSPVPAISRIITEMEELTGNRSSGFGEQVMATFIYINSGREEFGTLPATARMGITLRTFNNPDMALLRKKAETMIKKTATKYGLGVEISYRDEFPATENHPEAVQKILYAAKAIGLPLEMKEKPFRWSEDFAYFALTHKGALLGLGAGMDTPPLHHHTYDFPDGLIPAGAKLFNSIYEQIFFIHD